MDSTPTGDHAASSRATVAGSIEFIEYGELVKMAIKRARVAGGNRWADVAKDASRASTRFLGTLADLDNRYSKSTARVADMLWVKDGDSTVMFSSSRMSSVAIDRSSPFFGCHRP